MINDYFFVVGVAFFFILFSVVVRDLDISSGTTETEHV